MNVPEAVKAIEKLSVEMNESANNAQTASIRYDAHMALYNAAAMQGDQKEMEVQRLTLHSQLDAILDAGFEIHSRKRKIAEIQKHVHD